MIKLWEYFALHPKEFQKFYPNSSIKLLPATFLKSMFEKTASPPFDLEIESRLLPLSYFDKTYKIPQHINIQKNSVLHCNFILFDDEIFEHIKPLNSVMYMNYNYLYFKTLSPEIFLETLDMSDSQLSIVPPSSRFEILKFINSMDTRKIQNYSNTISNLPFFETRIENSLFLTTVSHIWSSGFPQLSMLYKEEYFLKALKVINEKK